MKQPFLPILPTERRLPEQHLLIETMSQWRRPIRITSPVTYGVLPEGAEELVPALPLVAGRTYQITMGVYDSATGMVTAQIHQLTLTQEP